MTERESLNSHEQSVMVADITMRSVSDRLGTPQPIRREVRFPPIADIPNGSLRMHRDVNSRVELAIDRANEA